MTEFAVVTLVGMGVLSVGQIRPHLQRRGLNIAKILGLPTWVHAT